MSAHLCAASQNEEGVSLSYLPSNFIYLPFSFLRKGFNFRRRSISAPKLRFSENKKEQSCLILGIASLLNTYSVTIALLKVAIDDGKLQSLGTALKFGAMHSKFIVDAHQSS